MKRAGLLLALAVALVQLPAQAAGPPKATLYCGQTISSSVTLANDLYCSDTALFIVADDVVLDLGGRTVHGQSFDPAIDGFASADRIIIRNGTIEGFAIGIDLETADSLIERVTIKGGSIGIRTGGDSHDNLFQRNKMIDVERGIDMGGDGETATRNKMTRVTVGVTFSPFARNGAATANKLTGVGLGAGVVVAPDLLVTPDDNNFTIDSNSAKGFLYGIQVGDQRGSADVTNNKVTGNTEHGIFDDGEGTLISGNTASKNGFFNDEDDDFGLGIDATSDATVTGSGNTAKKNDDPDQCEPVGAAPCV